MKAIKNFYMVIILILFSSAVQAVSPEWVLFSNTDLREGGENLFHRVKALSDTSVWVCGPGHGVYIYKNGQWRNLYEFWHTVGQHFWIWHFNDIVENYQNSKWLGDVNLIQIKPLWDTLEIHHPIAVGIEALEVKDNYLWFVTSDSNGLIRFDGTNAITFPGIIPSYDSNSTFKFHDIEIDSAGNFWLASVAGLFKFDGSQYTRYCDTNSAIPNNEISSLLFDRDKKLWMTFSDINDFSAKVASFDGTNWTVYDSSNSTLPNDSIWSWTNCIAVDSSNNKWIGSMRGIFKFDGTNWTKFDTSNSDLPNNDVYSLSIDKLGNLWIGTSNGLAVYKEGGVNLPTSVNDEKKDIPSFSVFPNPSENTIKIKYTNVTSGQVKITLTDMNGNIKMERVRNPEVSGEQTDIIDTSTLDAGTYFVKVEAGKESAVNKVVIVK